METEVLIDENIFPNSDVLKTALGEEQYKIYLDFVEQTEKLNLIIEWRFYKDTKTWLGKILNKNKNIGWLSVWNVGFKVTVFFNEKTLEGLNELNLRNDIDFFTSEVKPTGKLLPTRTTINNDSVLSDIVKMLEYKIKIK